MTALPALEVEIEWDNPEFMRAYVAALERRNGELGDLAERYKKALTEIKGIQPRALTEHLQTGPLLHFQQAQRIARGALKKSRPASPSPEGKDG